MLFSLVKKEFDANKRIKRSKKMCFFCGKEVRMRFEHFCNGVHFGFLCGFFWFSFSLGIRFLCVSISIKSIAENVCKKESVAVNNCLSLALVSSHMLIKNSFLPERLAA